MEAVGEEDGLVGRVDRGIRTGECGEGERGKLEADIWPTGVRDAESETGDGRG